MAEPQTERISDEHAAQLQALQAAKEQAQAVTDQTQAAMEATPEWAAFNEAGGAQAQATESLNLFVAFLCSHYIIDTRRDRLRATGEILRAAPAPGDVIDTQSRARQARAQARAQARNQAQP